MTKKQKVRLQDQEYTLVVEEYTLVVVKQPKVKGRAQTYEYLYATRNHRIYLTQALDLYDYSEPGSVDQLIKMLKPFSWVEEVQYQDGPSNFMLHGDRAATKEEIPLIDQAWVDFDKRETERLKLQEVQETERRKHIEELEREQLRQLQEKYPDAIS